MAGEVKVRALTFHGESCVTYTANHSLDRCILHLIWNGRAQLRGGFSSDVHLQTSVLSEKHSTTCPLPLSWLSSGNTPLYLPSHHRHHHHHNNTIMAPGFNLSRQRLAIHPQRNVPSSLLKKRCHEKFAQVLHEYEEEEGHAVDWAIIFESGRDNKMLLISIYGEHDPYPIEWTDDVILVDSEGKVEGGGKGGTNGGNENSQGDNKGEVRDQSHVEKSSRDDETKSGASGGKQWKQRTGDKSVGSKKKNKKNDDEKQSKKNKKNDDDKGQTELKDGENEDEPLFTATETYKIMGSSEDEDSDENTRIPDKKQTAAPNDASDGSKNITQSSKKQMKKRTGTETYEVVGTIMEGKVEWFCHDDQYDGFEDFTIYFNKDGLSMVHGVRFHDRIKERQLAALAELEKLREMEYETVIAEKNAKKAVKKARQRAVCRRSQL